MYILLLTIIYYYHLLSDRIRYILHRRQHDSWGSKGFENGQKINQARGLPRGGRFPIVLEACSAVGDSDGVALEACSAVGDSEGAS